MYRVAVTDAPGFFNLVTFNPGLPGPVTFHERTATLIVESKSIIELRGIIICRKKCECDYPQSECPSDAQVAQNSS